MLEDITASVYLALVWQDSVLSLRRYGVNSFPHCTWSAIFAGGGSSASENTSMRSIYMIINV